MRSLLTLMVILNLLVFSSCQDDDLNASHLRGDWELNHFHGGLLPGKSFSPGNGFILKFTDTDYLQYANGQLVRHGEYSIRRERSFIDNKVMNRIIYDHDETAPKTFYQISDQNLTLYFAAPVSLDGMETVYQRR